MTILSYLKQPFPKAENKWKVIVPISLFVTLFLFVFQPFGILQLEDSYTKYLFLSGFGLVTFFILVIDLIIIERSFYSFFREKNWNLFKELLWLFCVVFSIGLGNVLYTSLFSGQHLTLDFIITFQATTFAVATFPIALFIITKHNYLLKKYTTSANAINDSLKQDTKLDQPNRCVHLYAYNQKKKIEVDINDLYFIESKGNDIHLYIYENNRIICKTLRNTLKKALEYLVDSPEIVQCHRAFIVNRNKIIRVDGNSQGLVLKLENCDVEVPVSRSFVEIIRSEQG